MQIMLTDERIYSELLWLLISVDCVMIVVVFSFWWFWCSASLRCCARWCCLWRETWPRCQDIEQGYALKHGSCEEKCGPSHAVCLLLQYLFLEQANKLQLKYSQKMTWNRKIISLWWGEFLLRYFNNSVLQCSHPQLICKIDNNNRQARLVALRISCISPAVHLSTSEKRCRT